MRVLIRFWLKLLLLHTTAFLANYSSQKEEFARNSLQAAESSATAELCNRKTQRRRQRGDRNECIYKRKVAMPSYKSKKRGIKESLRRSDNL